jgi:hypothetical protein
MDAKQELFTLMAVAKQHQQAVQEAIDSLAKERVAMSQAVASVVNVADQIKKSTADTIPALRKAANEAVGASMGNSIDKASDAAVTALREAVKPVVKGLSGVVQAASAAEGQLKTASKWFAWKWVALAAGGLAGVCLVAYASLAWQLHQVESLSQEKVNLAADVAQLQANVAALVNKGGRIVMTTCAGRLCIEASSNQGQGSEQWKGGSWSNKETGVQLVIPKGY